ncbi:unnamed protein product [Closterium sp. Naga37s-1]|nr:unnamed protein product [Closterium sp. Naga37s-1]
MASRRRFPTSVVNHRCRGTPDCTCAFCQDFAAVPPANRAANVAANPAAIPATASAGTTSNAPRILSTAEEAAALRAAVDFGGAAPDYLRRGRADSQSGADGPLGDRVGPAIDGVARAATGGEGGGRGEEAIDAQSRREMAAGRSGLIFATGMRGQDVPPVPSLLQLCVGEVGCYLPCLLRMDSREFDLRGFVALLPSHARVRVHVCSLHGTVGRMRMAPWDAHGTVGRMRMGLRGLPDCMGVVDISSRPLSTRLFHFSPSLFLPFSPSLILPFSRLPFPFSPVPPFFCFRYSLSPFLPFSSSPSPPSPFPFSLLSSPSPLRPSIPLPVFLLRGSPACNKVARAAVKWMLPQQPVRGTEGAESAEAGEEEVEGETAQGEREGGEGGWEGSWEEVEERLEERVPALWWLIWPEADPNTASLLASKCPRILLNPAPPSPPPPHSLPPPYCHIPTTLPSSDPSIPPNLPTSIPALPSALLSRTPLQAFPALPLDAPHLVGIPPAVWERGAGEDEEEGEEGEEDGEEGIRGEAEARGRRRGLAMEGARAKVKPGAEVPQEVPQESEAPQELSVAERFRLAFVARDERLAPKRAKNQRQRERREGRDRAAADVALRARLLAGAATRSLRL